MGAPLIRIGKVFSRIEAPSEMLFLLDRELSVEVPGAYFAMRHRPGWDGMWHPLNVYRGTFPTGLLERVKKILPLVHVADEREKPQIILPVNRKVLNDAELSDHQIKSTTLSLEKGQGIVGTGVGSGKTETGIAIACHVPGLCVWITHRKDLFHQTLERIKWRTGEEAARLGDGFWDKITPETKFAIVMPQTVLKAFKAFVQDVSQAKVLVCDEAHRTGAAAEFYKIAMAVPAYFRIGLTGTLDLGDAVRELRFEAATGPVLLRMRSKEMAEIGWVVPAEVIYHRVENIRLPGYTDYRDARRILIEENPERNAMIVELAMDSAREGKRCLVICDTIRHASVIAQVLRGEDVRSRILTGHNSGMARVQAKKDLRIGALEVMISTPIWDEGVDLPELEVVIIAAGGKSAARVIQRCGRALRRSPGKTKATIHDFVDTGSGYTMRHSIARMEACRKEGFEVKGDIERVAAHRS